MAAGQCKWCNKPIIRRGRQVPVFCSITCKAEWQKTQKPIDRDRLFQLYVGDHMGTYQIARIVGRDPKRVYEWLKGFGIPIRPRTWDVQPGQQPYHDKAWLEYEYVEKARSSTEIAAKCGVSENNILFFLHKFDIPRRTMDEVRAVKYWGSFGKDNPMYGRRGEENPNWRGGVSPERQAFYESEEWRTASQLVWKRDKATCQRCGIVADGAIEMHIHHIVSFAVTALRASPENLILLCRECHHFVHSSENVSQKLIGEQSLQDCKARNMTVEGDALPAVHL